MDNHATNHWIIGVLDDEVTEADMKPKNFPERARLRKARALERLGLPIPSELLFNRRAERSKKTRLDTRRKK